MSVRGRCAAGAVAGVALAVAAASAAAQAGPVGLRLPDAAALTGQTYTVSLVHEVQLQSSGRSVIQREARLRFTFVEATAAGRDRVRTVIVLDSVRAAVSSPHGREVMDLRRLSGTRITAEYARSGGAPTWGADVPVLEFGPFGGGLSVSTLIDVLFPALPDAAVAAGATWERTAPRQQLSGPELTTPSVTTRHTLERVDAAHGGAARLALSTRTPEGRGTAVLELADGRVREATQEYTTSGAWDFGGTPMPFRQTTTVQAARVGATH